MTQRLYIRKESKGLFSIRSQDTGHIVDWAYSLKEARRLAYGGSTE